MFELDFEAKTLEAIGAVAAVLLDPALSAYEPQRKALLDALMWLESDVTCGDCIEGGGCHGGSGDEDCGCARHEASVEARERRTALRAAGVLVGQDQAKQDEALNMPGPVFVHAYLPLGIRRPVPRCGVASDRMAVFAFGGAATCPACLALLAEQRDTAHEAKAAPAPALSTLRDAYLLPEVKQTPTDVRDYVAKFALIVLRQSQNPDQRTWGPGDPEPAPVPSRVVDGDGDTWHRDHTAKVWSMAGFEPDWHEPGAGKRLTWSAMVREYGPVTGEPRTEDLASAAAKGEALLIAAINTVEDCAGPDDLEQRVNQLHSPPR